MDNLLEIKDLTVQYVTDEEVVHAVNGIDITLGRGETIGVVGETGAGKSTTALAIMKLLPKYTGKIPSGEITFDGIDILNATEAEMRTIRGGRISMIFQDPMTSLNPVLSVRNQIEEVLRYHREDLHSKADYEKEVGRLLEMVGIPAARMDEYPHQFSGGMKQRVVIAIAIACDPELLIADEPTTALDVTIQAQVLHMMRKLRQQLNSSMILITHDLGVVASICDKVAIMYAGEILEYGTLEDVFDTKKEHHPYTVGLFDSIPNLTVKTDRLKPIDGLMPDPTDLPAGCRFHPRCPKCTPACMGFETYTDENGEEQQRPLPPIPVVEANGHKVKCILAQPEAL